MFNKHNLRLSTIVEVKNKNIKRGYNKKKNDFESYNHFLRWVFAKYEEMNVKMDLTEEKFIEMVKDFNNNTK